MPQNLIITNNPEVASLYPDICNYYPESLPEILYRARDLIHLQHHLISHPLAGSVKPNTTPYKSVILTSEQQSSLDLQSLQLIENAIQVTLRMLRDQPLRNMDSSIRADFALIDKELIKSALERQ